MGYEALLAADAWGLLYLEGFLMGPHASLAWGTSYLLACPAH